MVMEVGWRWDEVEEEMVERGEIWEKNRKIKWRGRSLRENEVKMERNEGEMKV